MPPPNPRHITAQQLLALALQQGSFGRRSWAGWWAGLPVMDGAEDVLDYLLAQGFLEADGDLLFIGPAAESRFGRRHFMDLTAVFTADPELTVLHGRTEVGSVSPVSLTEQLPQGRPRVLALAGRAWVVTHVDWRRRTVSVAASESPGRSRWGHGGMSLGRDMAQSMRAVLLGEDPDVPLSRRGVVALEKLRAERRSTVAADGTVLARDAKSARWWTYAGGAANTSLATALTAAGYEVTADSFGVGIAGHIDVAEMRAASLAHADAVPTISPEVLEGLKFSAALPVDIATEVLAQRMTDPDTAKEVAQAPLTVVTQ
jgi:ATP-dependent Lhr-like helicase